MSSIPARRRTRKGPDARRAQIADAATAIALEQGLLGVTLRAVAARIEVAPGLVAHYAPSMDDLVAEAFASIVSGELEELRELVGRTDELVHRVGALIDTLLDGSRDDVTLVWVQAWALGSRNEPLAGAVRAQMDVWQAFIAGLVAEGVAEGVFRVDDPEAVAWQLLAMIDGLNAHSLVRWHAAPDRRALTKRSVAALLGLAPDIL